MNKQVYRVEVIERDYQEKLSSHRLVQVAHQLGFPTVTGAFVARVFFLHGDLSAEDITQLGRELLADPVTDTFHIDSSAAPSDHRVEVTFLAGVTDPVAENLVKAAHMLGVTGLEEAATGQIILLNGKRLRADELNALASKAFSNAVIQRYTIDTPIAPPFIVETSTDATVDHIALAEASDEDLLKISAERRLALNLQEMQAIRDYYRREERDASDLELEMIAQTWSEHCVHKTFKAHITYTGPSTADPTSPVATQEVHGLINDYLRRATDELQKPWVRSAFVDNAGIIAFNDQHDIAFKVETHNHPSAIEPFGGANTGVGGVIRDVLGVSARPIANTDILCFGPQDLPYDELPDGMLHPQRIQAGVVHGVEDYGNKMGIPTVNGAILYQRGYTANPLVFCGSLGILPHGAHRTDPQPNDLIVVIGGRTGRDGLRGATFSSMEMDGTTGEVAGSSVQIGHPIQEKQVLEVILRARDENLYNAITDCGAGGLSSAVGEMGEDIGAEVQLQNIPLKYAGLRPWEIWLSEAQERMVLAVAPEHWERMQTICAGQDVEVVAIGTFTPTGRLTLKYGETVVGEMAMDFLHNGIPQRHMVAAWTPPPPPTNGHEKKRMTPAEALLKLLGHPNIRSKESIIRRYDHEVHGSTAVKPLVGVEGKGAGDGSVLVPLDSIITPTPNPSPASREGESAIADASSLPFAKGEMSQSDRGGVRGVALSNGICPQYGEIDPYAMAWAAVDEAMRNLVAVGANPNQVAILDNFCWGNPNLPDRLGSLVRCVQGCYDAAKAYGVPYISGKDSLNNEYLASDGQRHAIPGTLLISAVGIVPDVAKTVTMDLKQAGNRLFLLGETRAELGGSHYYTVKQKVGGTVPQPNLNALLTLQKLHEAMQAGWILACHDCSEGGLAVAVAEMCIAGGLGASLHAHGEAETFLFSESLGRFVLEIAPKHQAMLEKHFADVPHSYLGEVGGKDLLVLTEDGKHLIQTSVNTLEIEWRGAPEKVNGVVKPTPKGKNATQPIKIHPKHVHTQAPKVLILHANGSNRDREAALACQMAGGEPEIVHINQLLGGERQLADYHMLVIPGGFSYGDDLGSGVIWAKHLAHSLADDIGKFIEQGRPVLGICNGFQVLVKSGWLPGDAYRQKVTLTYNESGHFECRWVYLKANARSNNLFTEGLSELIYCPVAHGEGRIAVSDDDTLRQLWQANLPTLSYTDADGNPVGYPHNPNGSVYGIAGLSNAAGNVMGLMPHPEDHVFGWQHPRWHRGATGNLGLKLFENGIQRA